MHEGGNSSGQSRQSKPLGTTTRLTSSATLPAVHKPPGQTAESIKKARSSVKFPAVHKPLEEAAGGDQSRGSFGCLSGRLTNRCIKPPI
ncbi:unnamed protein product [Cochlearia groenlandica]